MNSLIHSQTIIPGGYVSGNWDAVNSPYLVDGDLLVHPDSTLTIGAGCEILFRGEFRFEIFGQLLVEGTEALPVSFTAETEGNKWKGLIFNTTDTSITDSSILEHGLIRDCYQNACLNIFNSSRLRVSGFTIRNGISFRGGGIRCISSDPIFENLLVENNSALDGAGISLEASNPLLRNCVIQQNSADGAGGGIVIFSGSSPEIVNCEFQNNSSFGSGGAVYINGSDPVFINCNFSENYGAAGGGSYYSGGAVSVKLGSFTRFENCIFINNTSNGGGGGIASFSPNLVINCLFEGNHSAISGGALYLSAGNPLESLIINNTIANNSSPAGSVLYAHNHVAIMKNCIAWNLDPSDTSSLFWLDAIMALDALDVAYSDLKNGQTGIELTGNAGYNWGPGNLDLDPVFMPNSFELSWQSPCIEAGTPDTSGLNLPESDLAGNPRLANDRIDIGAFEYQLPLIIQPSTFNIQHSLRVFPNPAKGWVNIDCAVPADGISYKIMDFKGALFRKGILYPDCPTKINISDLKAGIYFISFAGNDFNSAEKLVILD
jgi:hypothetical protein